MGSVELGANIFRITQTEALLEKQKEPNKQIATDTHYKVEKTVRKKIEELGYARKFANINKRIRT